MSQSLHELGQAVARAQDELLEGLDAPRLAPKGTPARNRGSQRRWWIGVAAAALITAAWVSIPTEPAEAPIALMVHGETSRAEQGRWLAAQERALTLHFSEGSTTTLSPHSQARVTKLDARGASVELLRGELSVAVHHRTETSWRIDAGPFQTKVVGTKFAITWEPERGELSLQLLEGAVLLTGPVVGTRRVATGERIHVSLPRRMMEVSLAESDTATRKEPAANAVVDPERSSAVAAEAGPERAPPKLRRSAKRSREDAAPDARPTPPEFVVLAKAGRYSEAVSSARRTAWESTLREAQPSELLLLADAARLSRAPDLAEEVYLRVRSRFAGSASAASSAFALGRLEHDQRHRHEQAVRWFATYLREAPGGAYACEARGRLMEVSVPSTRSEAARSYLQSCPTGAHAHLARQLLGSSPR